ncbi:MAG: 2TM domain-containing protein [Bacteroidota bacterium]
MMRIDSYKVGRLERLEQKRKRAKKKVELLKGFYNHVKIFILINGLLYLAKIGLFNSFLPEDFQLASYYFSWLNLHLIVWSSILLVHGIFLFHNRLPFVKRWEARQIKKYVDEDNSK